ncbi:polynucleotide adenylyltransferase [Vallitalea longa]|uniref:Polynucleotide adenylyltransferase n=1 Tax=Vallitalea longa TaxID=2936439 RepID=A0A9W5Y9L0_9FIRM|nr:HD domain-containing protein [Vallitalea longa]GKX28565.1 polynucleotide adenylyltransferase [Vallitalea longa]
MNKVKIDMPYYAKKIIDELMENGYEAYLVGGCVRDSLIGKVPNDWDITTSALPNVVKKLFDKTIDTGLKHGTVTILMDKHPIEVTTYRIDGEYEDNRRPSTVEFTNNLVEDLKRRDFTINAMAYNHKTGLVDVFNGIDDLEKGIIRCVGNPYERFNEDALRMLRAIRFSAQLGYIIDQKTRKDIIKCSSLIKNVSMERIQVELNKTLTSDNPKLFMETYKLELMKYILPEFVPCIGNPQNHPYHSYDIGEHILRSVSAIKADKTLRWTMLLHDIGKPRVKTTDESGIDHFYGHEKVSSEMAMSILKRLKFDNNTINKVVKLIKYHDITIKNSYKCIRRILKKIGHELFSDFLLVKKADVMSQNPDKLDDGLIMISNTKKIYEEIKANDQCISLKQLKVNGQDLINLGLAKGPEIGIILNKLLDMVIEDPNKNNKEQLIEIVQEIKN